MVIRLVGLPIAIETSLATITYIFFLIRFSRAYAITFSVSAAKPMQNGGFGNEAIEAKISGFSSSWMD